MNIMLFNVSFVKIGGKKAVLFLWVLIKLHFHVYLNRVYFGNKEMFYKFVSYVTDYTKVQSILSCASSYVEKMKVQTSKCIAVKVTFGKA